LYERVNWQTIQTEREDQRKSCRIIEACQRSVKVSAIGGESRLAKMIVDGCCEGWLRGVDVTEVVDSV